jgi:uncharacterized membrane protein
VASFEVNSEPHTGARLSVRLCVELIGSEFTSKDAAIQGGVGEITASLNAKLCDLPAWWWWCLASYRHLAIAQSFIYKKIISPTHKRTEGRAPVWGS